MRGVLVWSVLLCAVGGGTGILRAQPVPQSPGSVVVLTGSNSLSAQTANRVGTYQERPQRFWRWEFEPTLQLYGVPLSFYVLLSSEQREFRQNINAITSLFAPEQIRARVRGRIEQALRASEQYEDVAGLAQRYEEIRDSLAAADPQALQRLEAYRRLKELERLKEADPMEHLGELRRLGMISAAEQVMMWLPEVQLGVTYPSYSPLVLRGVALNGGSLLWAPGSLVLGLAGGRTRRPILRADSAQLSTYGQELYAVQLGFGRGKPTAVTVVALTARDAMASLPDTVRPLQGGPGATHVLGVQLKSALLKQYVTLEAEAATSLVTWDVSSPRPESPDLPPWLVRLLDLRVSSSVDFAYDARLTVAVPTLGSQMVLRSQLVGPGYFSYGVPSLRRDVARNEVRIQQRLWRRQLALGFGVALERDNLLGTKRATTRSTQYLVSLGVTPRRFPFLHGNAAYSEQQNSFGVHRTLQWQLSLGHSYALGRVAMTSTLSYGQSQSTGFAGRTGIATLTVGHSVSFPFPLSLELAFHTGMPVFAGDTLQQRSTQLAVTAGYRLWESVTLSLTPTVSREGEATRLSLPLRLQLDLKRWGILRMELSATRYRNPTEPTRSFEETVVQAAFEQRW